MNTDILNNFNFEQIGAVGLTVILILGICFFFIYKYTSMVLGKNKRNEKD